MSSAPGWCWRRAWPVRRGRPVRLDLPPVSGPGAAVAASEAVLLAVAEGRLTAEEAAGLGGVIAAHVRALEAHELERRIVELEKRAEGRALRGRGAWTGGPRGRAGW